MGFAGMMIIGMVVCLFKSIVSVINFLIWKNKLNAVCTVKELKSESVNYGNDKKTKITSKEYTYLLVINDNDNLLVDYIETVSGDSPSKVEINSSFDVFVDTNKKEAKSAKFMKRQIWEWALGIIFFLALFILSTILIFVIDMAQ